ncbi:hypothetical protein, unlikely [Trypanosoma congolense IL3000]|uniref:Variant surface glycoprotein n=1 Tax=Trypanosoma congolense (strain IL3000) TaxID=1068625 RepID=F9W9B6_TRYCI|nr:hypothetical protein, unlikely [Trypanosoma congolense IL3000]
MEWQVWRKVLFFSFFMGMGGRRAEADGVNRDVFNKLCGITMGVRLLINQGVEAKIFLDQALDGRNERARFNEHGILTKHGCGRHPSGRGPYGSHIQAGIGALGTASWERFYARVFHL